MYFLINAVLKHNIYCIFFYQCNSIVAFTTYWKFWCCCIHYLFSVNECQWLVYTHTFPFIPKYVLCFQIHVSCFCWLNAQFMNTRLVIMSVSLHTQTGLHCLIIQVLNTRVWFLNIRYTSLTSVHSNLEHGLAILQRALVHSNLNYTTSLVKVQSRSPLQ